MKLQWLVSGAIALMGLAQAQTTAPGTGLDAAVLGFERVIDGRPAGLNTFPAEKASADPKVKRTGANSLRLEAGADTPLVFAAFNLPIDFQGETVELRGWLRRQGKAAVTLWLRQDGPDGPAGYVADNEGGNANGEWTQRAISLPLEEHARTLVFGLRLMEPGEGWADDLELWVDGKPLAQAPRLVREDTVLDRDTQFAKGGALKLEQVDARQLKALVLVGKVWGFLKYHHPAVTAGKHHWDFELLRQLPALIAARDSKELQSLLLQWIDSLGPVVPCEKNCTELNERPLHLSPSLAWIRDRKALGADLSERMQQIHRSRVAEQQFFVRLARDVGKPRFVNEPAYEQAALPDAGFQILGVLRFWNAIEYWFPYRDLIGEKWDAVLEDTLARAVVARDEAAYQKELMHLVARVDDGHAGLVARRSLLEPRGACRLPVSLRYVQGKFVVEALLSRDHAASPFKSGDVIETIGGRPVNDLASAARFGRGASNEAWLMQQIARFLTNGECGKVRVAFSRGETQEVTAARVQAATLDLTAVARNDRDGDTFQQLSKDVAYLKLSTIKAVDVAGYIEKAAGSKLLVVDIRNYPSEFVVFALGSLLVDGRTPIAKFTKPDLSNPGAFAFGPAVALMPHPVHFAGRVAILVDESSISQAEYTAMALRASPRARLYGRMTAGADGDVSRIPLIGGFAATFSGIGAFYPDGAPTQQLGVKLDVECPVTIAGLAAGRDEILDCALRDLGMTH